MTYSRTVLGYLNIASALKNTDKGTGIALSPRAVYDPMTGLITIDNSNWASGLLSKSVRWGNSVLWGNSMIWGNSILWGDSLIRGDAPLVSGSSVIWGDSVV